MTRPRIATVALLVSLAATPLVAAALERPQAGYRARAGDTLELIAAEYYGERALAPVIAMANPTVASPPAVGATLSVPLSSELITAPGDTLAGLAATHLGDANRAAALASWNRLRPSASLPAGVALRVPIVVPVRLTAPDTVTAIAERYLGAGTEGEALRQYNGLDHDEVAAGDVVLVPMPWVTVRADKLPPRAVDAQARIDRRVAMVLAAQGALGAGRAAWRRGDMNEVKRLLTPLDRAFLDRAVAAEVGVLLGAAYLMLADADSAAATFASVRLRAPALQLSRYDFPPVVCEAWVRAGGSLVDAP